MEFLKNLYLWFINACFFLLQNIAAGANDMSYTEKFYLIILLLVKLGKENLKSGNYLVNTGKNIIL